MGMKRPREGTCAAVGSAVYAECSYAGRYNASRRRGTNRGCLLKVGMQHRWWLVCVCLSVWT